MDTADSTATRIIVDTSRASTLISSREMPSLRESLHPPSSSETLAHVYQQGHRRWELQARHIAGWQAILSLWFDRQQCFQR